LLHPVLKPIVEAELAPVILNTALKRSPPVGLGVEKPLRPVTPRRISFNPQKVEPASTCAPKHSLPMYELEGKILPERLTPTGTRTLVFVTKVMSKLFMLADA